MADWVTDMVRRIAGTARVSILGRDRSDGDRERVRHDEIRDVMGNGDRFCRICVDSIVRRWCRPVPPDERQGDLMQVARIALHKAEAGFDHARGRFPDFAAHRVVWDVRDYLESRSAPSDCATELPACAAASGDTALQAARRVDLARAMDGLDDRDSEVLDLWLYGAGDPEISRRTGLTPNEVEAAQRRWRRKLAGALDGYGPAHKRRGSDGN